MNTYISLFRGIKVGAKHILPMKDQVKIASADIYPQPVKTHVISTTMTSKK